MKDELATVKRHRLPSVEDPATGSVVVRFSAAGRRYGRFEALRGISLDFEPGVTALLGRNGAGKSTLVRLLVGIEEPTEGQVEVRVNSPGEKNAASAEKMILSQRDRFATTGWLPQVFGYPAGMTVRNFIAYAAWLKEVPSEVQAAWVDEALTFADVRSVAGARLGRLSGGNLRRVGLAAAVVHKPQLLVLDEPTTGLDPIQRAQFHERLNRYGDGMTIILATHILEDVDALAKRVHVLESGSHQWSGSAEDLIELGSPQLSNVERLRDGFLCVLDGAPK